MNLKRTLVLAAAALMTATGMVNAATRTASQTGDWNNTATWNGDPVPGVNDTAVISSAVTVTLSATASATITVTRLEISNGGILQVNSDDSFTMGSGFITGGASQFNVNGRVILDGGQFQVNDGIVDVMSGAEFVMQGASPVLDINKADGVILRAADSRLEVVDDATISGDCSGSLKGEDPDASIVINVDGQAAYPDRAINVNLDIDSDVIVHGTLTFKAEPDAGGSASLNNMGLIWADAGVILLDASLADFTDANASAGVCGLGTCDPTWKTSSGSTLQFDLAPSANLQGTFHNFGTLALSANLTTSGKKNATGGSVTGGSLTASGGTCP